MPILMFGIFNSVFWSPRTFRNHSALNLCKQDKPMASQCVKWIVIYTPVKKKKKRKKDIQPLTFLGALRWYECRLCMCISFAWECVIILPIIEKYIPPSLFSHGPLSMLHPRSPNHRVPSKTSILTSSSLRDLCPAPCHDYQSGGVIAA